MVRFEKLAYEQLVNSAMANRARKMTAPAKFFQQNRWKDCQIDSVTLCNTGLTGMVYRLLEPLIARFTYQH